GQIRIAGLCEQRTLPHKEQLARDGIVNGARVGVDEVPGVVGIKRHHEDGGLLRVTSHSFVEQDVPTVWQERRKDVSRCVGFGDRYGLATSRGHLEQWSRASA